LIKIPDFGGGDGKITTNFGYDERAAAVAIQPDGKIIVAGTVEINITKILVFPIYSS